MQVLSPDGGPIVVSPEPNPSLSLTAQFIVTNFEYDETGNLRKVQTSGSQSSTEYWYDNTTQYSLPSSTTTGLFPQLYITERSTWDLGLGLPLRVTDADGLKTEISYQPAAAGWRLKMSKSPTGVLTSYDYEDKYLNVGVKVTDTEGGSYYQSARYDGRGLLRESRKRLRDTGGHEIAEYQYDIMGRVTAEILPRHTTEAQQPARLVQFSYDPAGRLVKRTEPDGSATQWLYNNEATKIRVAGCKVLGETIGAIDSWGRETWQSTDSFGQLGCVVEPHDVTGKPETGGLLTEYHRDALGRIYQIRQGSQVRSFRYDTLSRLTAAKYPERMPTLNDAGVYVGSNGKWSDVYEYDLLSNLVGYTDARGVKTRWDYKDDLLNRLQSVVYDTSGVGDTTSPIPPTPFVQLTYEPSGDLRRIKTIWTPGMLREVREHDSFGRLVQLSNTTYLGFPLPSAPRLVSEYTYDSLNRLRTMKYPSLYENGAPTGTKALTYRYSHDGDLIGLDLDGNKIIRNAEYNVFGLRRLELSLGAKVLNEYYFYSSRNGRITKQTVDAGYGKTLLDLAYIYNREGVPGAKPEIKIQYDLQNASNDQSLTH
jgi:YD repeat-containing protein